ncbi:hypothetical protein D3C80_1475470 [compost metagenome]
MAIPPKIIWGTIAAEIGVFSAVQMMGDLIPSRTFSALPSPKSDIITCLLLAVFKIKLMLRESFTAVDGNVMIIVLKYFKSSSRSFRVAEFA